MGGAVIGFFQRLVSLCLRKNLQHTLKRLVSLCLRKNLQHTLKRNIGTSRFRNDPAISSGIHKGFFLGGSLRSTNLDLHPDSLARLTPFIL